MEILRRRTRSDTARLRIMLAAALLMAMVSAFALRVQAWSGRDVGSSIVETATGYLGAPYGVEPRAGGRGFDCSLLSQTVFAKHGIELPRRSRDQATAGSSIALDDVRAGDLLFFSVAPNSRRISHVAIATGDGRMIHASTSRKMVVIDSVDWKYYRLRFVAARRIIAPTGGTGTSMGRRR